MQGQLSVSNFSETHEGNTIGEGLGIGRQESLDNTGPMMWKSLPVLGGASSSFLLEESRINKGDPPVSLSVLHHWLRWANEEQPLMNLWLIWRCGCVCVQSLSSVRLFVTPLTTAHQASLSFTISQSLLKLMSIESVMPSNHLILCRPLLLCPQSVPPSGSFPRSVYPTWINTTWIESHRNEHLPERQQDQHDLFHQLCQDHPIINILKTYI